MKFYLTLLMSLCLVPELHARIKQFWSYDKLTDKATLIVIATPTEVAETAELAALPDIATVHRDGTKEAVMGKGVETRFDVLTVLKEEPKPKTSVLHHFRLAKLEPMFNGPLLVAFEPKEKKRFLMFLQRDADGRYVAVSGQTDPKDAIKEIVGTYP